MAGAQNSWELVSPRTPNGIHSDLTDVSFWSESGGVVVGTDQFAYYTIDSGRTWTPKATPTVFDKICYVDALHGISARSIFNEDQGVEVYASIWNTSDGGKTWILKGNDGNFYTRFRSIGFWDTLHGCIIGDYHHFAGHYGITSYSTADGGNFWSSADLSSLGASSYWGLSSLSIVDQHTGYALLWNAAWDNPYYRLLRTTDAGHSWKAYGDGTFRQNPVGNFVNQLTGTIIDNGSTIMRSEDGGLTWHVQGNPGKAGLTSVCFGTPNIGVAVGENGAIISTNDGGKLWQKEPTLTSVTLMKVFVSRNGNVIAIGNSGVIIRGHIRAAPWILPDATFPLIVQNYPNPFNGSTRIPFVIDQSGYVTLKIFDLLGREVATLVHEDLEIGSYERPLDGTELSSGIYLVCLQAGGKIATSKLVHLK
jgi:photosystem II stability/assembly factor-like uncharacterized protein